MRVAKDGKMIKEEGEVNKREGGGNIIDVGHGGSKGAKAIITRGREKVAWDLSSSRDRGRGPGGEQGSQRGD